MLVTSNIFLVYNKVVGEHIQTIIVLKIYWPRVGFEPALGFELDHDAKATVDIPSYVHLI